MEELRDLFIKIGTNSKELIDRGLIKRSLTVAKRTNLTKELKKLATCIEEVKKRKPQIKRPRDIVHPPIPSATDPPPIPPADNQPIPPADNQPIPGGSKTPSNIQPVESPTPPGRKSDNYSLKNFEENIVPQIRERIAEYGSLHPHLEWNLELNFLDNPSNLKPTDLASIKQLHEQLVDTEKTALNLHLLIAYHRGMCYLSARKYMPTDIPIKEWFPQEFGLPYITINRYCQFSTLIKSYPGLIYCGLSFTQLTKHHSRIENLLNIDDGLRMKLKSRVEICAHNSTSTIDPVETQVENELNLNVDPGYKERLNSSSSSPMEVEDEDRLLQDDS